MVEATFLFCMVPRWSTDFFYITDMFSQVSVRLSLQLFIALVPIHNFVQIIPVFCLFPCFLKGKIIPISKCEINYTIGDKKNTIKKTKPISTLKLSLGCYVSEMHS